MMAKKLQGLEEDQRLSGVQGFSPFTLGVWGYFSVHPGVQGYFSVHPGGLGKILPSSWG